MVVIPFWEHTESHNVLFLFLSLYPHQERKPKGNQGALQEEDHCAYRSALILSLWPIQVRFRLLFTAWLSIWDIVYDWLLESIIGSYSTFMLTDTAQKKYSLYCTIRFLYKKIVQYYSIYRSHNTWWWRKMQ